MSTDLRADEQWTYLERFLPSEEQLFEAARVHGAMQRKRKIRTATQLLRLCLVWAGCRYSLTRTAAWAQSAFGVRLTDEGLTQRFAHCGQWLSALVYEKLVARSEPPKIAGLGRRRIRIIDATSVTAPGQKISSWRLHLGLDLVQRQLTDVSLTTNEEAEDVQRFDIAPGDLVLGDRRYCQRAQLAGVIEREADFIIRLNWHNVPLEGRQGEPFDLFEVLGKMPDAKAQSFAVRTKTDPRRGLTAQDVWVVALRKSPEAAQADRERLIKKRRHQGGRKKKIDPRTIEATGYFIVLTTLDPEKVAPEAVLELYRFRWQIELEAKRLKSLHHLDELPAQTDPMVRTWLMAQMYMALLTEEIADAPSAFSPWGYPVRRGASGQSLACH